MTPCLKKRYNKNGAVAGAGAGPKWNGSTTLLLLLFIIVLVVILFFYRYYSSSLYSSSSSSSSPTSSSSSSSSSSYSYFCSYSWISTVVGVEEQKGGGDDVRGRGIGGGGGGVEGQGWGGGQWGRQWRRRQGGRLWRTVVGGQGGWGRWWGEVVGRMWIKWNFFERLILDVFKANLWKKIKNSFSNILFCVPKPVFVLLPIIQYHKTCLKSNFSPYM